MNLFGCFFYRLLLGQKKEASIQNVGYSNYFPSGWA